MNIQDLGSIGELIAAIATVATLAYLAYQIRQNTKTVTASTELETGRMWVEFLARTAHNDEVAISHAYRDHIANALIASNSRHKIPVPGLIIDRED